jgi:hypothetical protein
VHLSIGVEKWNWGDEDVEYKAAGRAQSVYMATSSILARIYLIEVLPSLGFLPRSFTRCFRKHTLIGWRDLEAGQSSRGNVGPRPAKRLTKRFARNTAL